jgi:hypothetical protein
MAAPGSSGYSGTPLARKLGLKEDSQVALLGAPKDFERVLEPLPRGVKLQRRAGAHSDIVHLFVTRREELEEELIRLRALLRPAAVLWISWPKKAAKVPTTVTEETIRELALPLGWVDIKVCAVDEIWSGLKLVVRKALRDG